MGTQDSTAAGQDRYCAAAQFQGHASLPWSALPSVPYSILPGKAGQRSPHNALSSFVDKTFTAQEQARDLNALTERILPFPATTTVINIDDPKPLSNVKRALPELPVLPSPPLFDNASSQTPPTSTYFGSQVLSAKAFSSRWSTSSLPLSSDHKHRPYEPHHPAKVGPHSSKNNGSINHRSKEQQSHRWRCDTAAESGSASELQGHCSDSPTQTNVHWWHSIQAAAAATVNEQVETSNAKGQDLHLDQFRKDSMHDPVGQLQDVYRQFEENPNTRTTRFGRNKSKDAFLFYCTEKRQMLEKEIPNNTRSCNFNNRTFNVRDWKGMSQKSGYSKERAESFKQQIGMDGVTAPVPPEQAESGGVSTDHHSNNTNENGTRLANTILAWTVPQSMYEDELPPQNVANKNGDDEEENEEEEEEEDNDDIMGDNMENNRTPSHPSARKSVLKIPGTRNIVNVASHSAAAEAQALALANLTGTSPQKRPGRRFDEPERLKRPPNAYLLFNRDVRHQILAETPGLSVAEISKAISERWSQLPQERKDYYNQQAEKIKQQSMKGHTNFIYCRRSKAELLQAGYKSKPSKKRKTPENDSNSNGNGSSSSSNNSNGKANPEGRDPRGRKKKRLKHPKAPKHPMSAFLFYSKSVRSSVAARMPNASVGQVSKIISQQWRSMTDQERMPWEQKAKDDKARYAREMHTYSCKEDMKQQQQQPPLSPVELDSLTIATVARMVNPKNQDACLLPPLYDNGSGHGEQFQILPATPPPS